METLLLKVEPLVVIVITVVSCEQNSDLYLHIGYLR